MSSLLIIQICILILFPFQFLVFKSPAPANFYKTATNIRKFNPCVNIFYKNVIKLKVHRSVF